MPDITTLFEGTDGATRENFNQKLSDVNAHGNDTAAHISTALHTRTGTVNNLAIPDGAKNLTFLATATIADGDTWTVNGNPVTAVLQNGEPLPGELFKSGCWVTGVYWDGTRLGFRSGAATVPSIFGNGSDGDAVISGTVTLPVPVPHQSIIEKQYKSLTINAGGILRAAAHNAGLIIRVQGDCVIHGTIDQSGLAPKTNPDNNYPYPTQLVCGDGGNGGSGKAGSGSNKSGGVGGVGMLKRSYGGGYGGGAGAGSGQGTNMSGAGGNGGSSTDITIDTPDIFRGGIGAAERGQPGTDGAFGGGAGGGHGGGDPGGIGGDGGTGGGNAGNSGTPVNNSSGGAGGGAGNYGGGVVLLYIGGHLEIDGAIKCNGLNGGAGGKTSLSPYGDGGDGGGGGGGAIYILHRGTYTNTGLLQVNGGAGGNAGGVGSITVIQHTN